MQLNKIIQRDYTSFSLYYQIKLPLDLEISIPSDDPVRLVSAFVEEMDLSELYKTYGRIRKNQATPRQIEYYGAAEPPVRCGESRLSGLTESLHFVY